MGRVVMVCALLMTMGCGWRGPLVVEREQAVLPQEERRVVLVTGSASGIGKEVAERFLERGHIVYGADIEVRANAYLHDRRGGHAVWMDVREEEQVAWAVAKIVREQGRLDVVVNNAGYGSYGPIEEVPMREVENQFDVNVFGYVRVVQQALPVMRRQRAGRVIMVSSIVGEMAPALMGYYAGTKHAVEAISDALRAEVEPLGIEVVKVQPGPVNTRFDERALEGLRERMGEEDYAELMRDFEAYLLRTYRQVEGPGETAERIVEVALMERDPPAVVRTTFESKAAYFVRGWLSERGFDRMMRRQYRRAGRREQ